MWFAEGETYGGLHAKLARSWLAQPGDKPGADNLSQFIFSSLHRSPLKKSPDSYALGATRGVVTSSRAASQRQAQQRRKA
jgi:hypothetical protein